MDADMSNHGCQVDVLVGFILLISFPGPEDLHVSNPRTWILKQQQELLHPMHLHSGRKV